MGSVTRHPAKRLGHKKSRNGCLQCKARRVKCDEQRPCKSCIRFELACSLTAESGSGSGSGVGQPTEQASAATTSPASPVTSPNTAATPTPAQVAGWRPEPASPSAATAEASRLRSPSVPQALPPRQQSPASSVTWNSSPQAGYFSPDWMQSLRLLHHYDTAVWVTLTRDESTREVWRTTAPQVAFSNEAVMQAILALSALHYAIVHPEQREEYILISTHYQNLTLHYFSSRINDINEDNCTSFFFLASFIFILATCSIANPSELGKTIGPPDIAQTFTLLQGIKTIVDFQPMHRWRQDGPLAPLLREFPAIQVKREGPFCRRLDRLFDLARTLQSSFAAVNEQSACILAIESLRTVYSACLDADCVRRTQLTWLWPMSLTGVFIQLIRDSHAVSLVIVAHFAALARTHESSVWVRQNWSLNVLDAVERSLNEDWRKWMDWPRTSIMDKIDVDDMEDERETST